MVFGGLVGQQNRGDPPAMLVPERIHRHAVAVHGVHDHGIAGTVLRTSGHEKLHAPNMMRGGQPDDGFMPSLLVEH